MKFLVEMENGEMLFYAAPLFILSRSDFGLINIIFWIVV